MYKIYDIYEIPTKDEKFLRPGYQGEVKLRDNNFSGASGFAED